MYERRRLLFLATGLLIGAVHADTVIKEVPDTLPGKSFGGLSGFMAGITGGPIGAVVGTGVGWYLGGKSQKISGLSGTAYRVKQENGRETVIRSPNRTWSPGDRVRIVSGRLVADEDISERPEPVASVNP